MLSKLRITFFFLPLLILYIASYIGFKKQNIDLNEYSKIVSIVKEKGIQSTNNGSKCFYIVLKDYNKKLGVYRRSQTYVDLIDKITINDSTLVYFENNTNSESINLDLIQIESGNQIILNKNEYEKKFRILMYIGLFGGIAMSILSYFAIKREILIND